MSYTESVKIVWSMNIGRKAKPNAGFVMLISRKELFSLMFNLEVLTMEDKLGQQT